MIVAPCTVVTGGAQPSVIEGAGVRVVGSHIAQVASAGALAASYPDEPLYPARGRVLLPGFVNTHAHLSRHLARGLGLRTAAEWRRYEQALSPEDVRWATAAALVEGVRHGVTTVCDFHRSRSALDLTLVEVLDAARSVGVRIATCYGARETDPEPERRAATEESARFAGEVARRREGRLRGMVGVQATSLAGVESMLDRAFAAAGDRAGVHVDLALDLTPAERWSKQANWPATTHAALWAHAEAAPRDLLAAARDRGDVLSAVGSGSVAALVRDTDVAWGSDSGANAPPLPDATHGWTSAAPAETQYQRLFVHGARWAERWFGESLGTIAPGAPADFLLVEYRPATEFSTHTLLEHLWSGLLRAPILGVVVAGQIVMDNGVLVSMDEKEVASRARECSRRLWKRLG